MALVTLRRKRKKHAHDELLLGDSSSCDGAAQHSQNSSATLSLNGSESEAAEVGTQVDPIKVSFYDCWAAQSTTTDAETQHTLTNIGSLEERKRALEERKKAQRTRTQLQASSSARTIIDENLPPSDLLCTPPAPDGLQTPPASGSAAAVRKSVDDAELLQARTLVVKGLKRGHRLQTIMGEYELLEEKVVNGREVWQTRGDAAAFLFYSRTGKWCISTRRENMETGASRGQLYVESTAPTPDQAARGSWRVWDGSKRHHVPAPGLSVVSTGNK